MFAYRNYCFNLKALLLTVARQMDQRGSGANKPTRLPCIKPICR